MPSIYLRIMVPISVSAHSESENAPPLDYKYDGMFQQSLSSYCTLSIDVGS